MAYRFYGVDDRRGRGVLHGFVGNDVFHSVFTDENRGAVDISPGIGVDPGVEFPAVLCSFNEEATLLGAGDRCCGDHGDLCGAHGSGDCR